MRDIARGTRPIHTHVFAFATTTALAFMTAAAGAQTGVLTGTVSTDSLGRHPLAGAMLSIPALQLTTQANFAGDYRFAHVTPGYYLVIVQASGYKSIGDSAKVGMSGDSYHDFVLPARVTTLTTVVTHDSAPSRYTSPALQGFEARQLLGFGHFITEAELRMNDDRTLSNLLEHFPGLRIVIDKSAAYIASSRNQSGSAGLSFLGTQGEHKGCWATIFIDGGIMYDPTTAAPGTSPPDFSQLNISQYAGIEYYAGGATTPPQFSGQNTCGTLLLWTRER